jgi:hypothetical protein
MSVCACVRVCLCACVCVCARAGAASIHITRKASKIVRVNLNSYTPGDSYCRQKLVKGDLSIFAKENGKLNHEIDNKTSLR